MDGLCFLRIFALADGWTGASQKAGVHILPMHWVSIAAILDQAALSGSRSIMFQSYVIDIGGVFVGAAVTASEGYKFVAVDPRVKEMNGSAWPSVSEVRRVACCMLMTGHLPLQRERMHTVVALPC